MEIQFRISTLIAEQFFNKLLQYRKHDYIYIFTIYNNFIRPSKTSSAGTNKLKSHENTIAWNIILPFCKTFLYTVCFAAIVFHSFFVIFCYLYDLWFLQIKANIFHYIIPTWTILYSSLAFIRTSNQSIWSLF